MELNSTQLNLIDMHDITTYMNSHSFLLIALQSHKNNIQYKQIKEPSNYSSLRFLRRMSSKIWKRICLAPLRPMFRLFRIGRID